VQGERELLVLDRDAGGGQVACLGGDALAQRIEGRGGPRRPGLDRVLGTVIADHVARLETEPGPNVGDAAPGDDRDRQVSRQLGQAERDRFGHARLVGSRHDGRERAVKIEREQGAQAHDGMQRHLALGREQMLHLLRSPSTCILPRPLP
jgi:hypothetical protein